jgi:hypothetical protein
MDQPKVCNHTNFQTYGQRSYGFGVKAPVFSVYPYGTQFNKYTKPVPLCGSSQVQPKTSQTSQTYGDIPYEFQKMMRQKTMI